MHRRALLGLCCCATVALPAAHRVQAAGLGTPSGKVLLTVRGRIEVTNAGNAALFDLAMLDGLLQGRFEGETPWTKGRTVFSGPLGAAVLDAVQADGTLLRITALNDYSADVPVTDFRNHPVILATRRDGATMAVRDKGPIWVMYPMDREPELRIESTYTRSVWQVSQIDVV